MTISLWGNLFRVSLFYSFSLLLSFSVFLSRDLNATALSTVSYWINDKAHGIRYEDDDCTTELCIDWLYAKVPGGDDISDDSRVTLEQYYTYENTQIETPEYTNAVPTSDELSYKHTKGTEAQSERILSQDAKRNTI